MSSLNIKKISYWLSLLGLISALLIIPPQVYTLWDAAVATESEKTKIEYTIEANYQNLNGRMLYLEEESAKEEAFKTQREKDYAEYREKMQESVSLILQKLARMEERSQIRNNP